VVDGDAKRAAPRAGASAASRAHRAVAERLWMNGVKLGRLPAQALVEDELGHGRWGLIPAGRGLGHRVPQRGATCASEFGWRSGLAQMGQDRVQGRRLGE